jgi:hypothetical protein
MRPVANILNACVRSPLAMRSWSYSDVEIQCEPVCSSNTCQTEQGIEVDRLNQCRIWIPTCRKDHAVCNMTVQIVSRIITFTFPLQKDPGSDFSANQARQIAYLQKSL